MPTCSVPPMQLELLLSKILNLVPEYQVHIHSRHPLQSARFQPPPNTELFQFTAAHAPAYLSLLHERLAQAHPEGGKIYWSTTAWRILNWNPILFSVMAVHSLGKAVCLQGSGLWVTQDSIEGSALEDHPVFSGQEDELIHYAGQQIQMLMGTLHTAATQSFALPIKLAQKLTTDALVECLIMQNQLAQPALALRQDPLQTRLDKWLNAAGLPLITGTLLLPNGQLGLNRQVCCQYYRIQAGGECPDCTRIPMPQRLVMMAEHTH